MAATWVCPIDGSVPADNGSDQTKTNNVVNTTTGLDVNGNAPHCPLCGAAMVVLAALTAVTTATGQATPHPADVDATYVTMADSPLGQQVSTAYAATGTGTLLKVASRYPHAFKLTRGDQTVTAETVNTTVGP